AFGESVFEIIENEASRLTELVGIGSKRKNTILTAWAEQKVVRNIMIFLQSNGIGTARAVRIYKVYGDDAIDIIRDNPYRLALDIIGIGFKTADTLAMKLGIDKDSIKRAQAGVRHVLQEFASEGHCAIEREQLIKSSIELLEIPEEIITQAIINEIKEEHLVLDKIDSKDCLFLAALYQAECLSAKNIKRLKNGKPPWGIIDYEKALQWVEGKTGIVLSPSQRNAVTLALKEKIIIITGGPGVGKTTIINSILKIVRAKKINVSLCAPTGRAAKRLTEATGLTAKTIHRLLEYDPKIYAFKHNQNNHLSTDMVIVDEASMIDIMLWYNIVKSIPDHASLLIVGDIDQLPSVGPGAVLADMINSQTIPVVKLTEIFRQAANSQIIVNAHRINQGQFPVQNSTSLSDFYFIQAQTPEEIQEKLLHVVIEKIPKRFNFDPKRDIQVLTPMNRGGLGSRSLNSILQAKLNPNSEPKISRFGTTFAPGDKIIQNVNNYDKDVFNGDIGIIESIDLEESEVQINFDGHLVTYDFNELDEVALAYATSIHKSQGSEYPVVVIPISTQHYMLLARNLLYTAVTRGRKLVIIIGQIKALAIAIKNNSIGTRMTNLRSRLCDVL
ncbi:MAG: ATP-dependent RecD-like DNA helicase, partial [Candidatus Portnoybacteria bacterium]|nr:ATP-dependent RecD-like DNA helicase [Candidatus Portnoybacteria bacterium]